MQALHVGQGSRGPYGIQQTSSNADATPIPQHHQGKFGASAVSCILGVANHRVVGADCQIHCPSAPIEVTKAIEQGPVRGVAMRKVAFIEAIVVHLRQKVLDRAGILRPCQADHDPGPGLSGAHVPTPAAMNSDTAPITLVSVSRRRCPRPSVSSTRAFGQVPA